MTFLPHNLTRVLSHFLLACVLLAQQAALTHVVSHASAAHSTHEAQVLEQGRHSHAPGLAGLCSFHAAFGQVLSGGPATVHAVFSDMALPQSAFHRSGACITAEALTPRSRGPPPLR